MFQKRILPCLLVSAVTLFAGTAYTSIKLGPTPDQPGDSVGATALNNSGQAVGFEYGASDHDQTLVLWNAGVASAVPMPAGYALNASIFLSYPILPSINAAGQILAPALETASGNRVGILFTGGIGEVIGAFPNTCGAADTDVYGLNAAGHVVGTTTGASCKFFWVWANGAFKLFQPPKPTHFVLSGIDDADHVMGIRCVNVPVNEGCSEGPIFVFAKGQKRTAYQLGASATSAPNNLDQVTGFVLAGPGEDAILWLSPTSHVGIPPSGPLGQQANFYTNPNNAGFVVFQRPGQASPYAALHRGKDLGNLSGTFPTQAGPFALNDGLQFLADDQLFTPAPGSCAADVTGQISVVPGKLYRDASTGRFRQKVTLTNTGAGLAGPVSLLLDQLAPQVAVYGLSGTSTCSAPAGVSYVNLPASFGAAGSQATVHLQLINSAQAAMTWTGRVLAGTGGR